jgi:pyruvate formate lyase activating enzyme
MFLYRNNNLQHFMVIGGLQKLTLIDYPGKIACTVFTVGCNFRCPFCHNPELVDQVKYLSDLISDSEFFDFLKSRQSLLDGVCVTGGEPTLHKDLPEFFKKIKDLGFKIKLDTNGTNPEMLENLLKDKLIDYIAMDVKTNLKNYEKVVGTKVNLENIKKSVKIIMESGLDYEFRTTVVPGLHAEEDILALVGEISGAKKYYLQQFRPGEKVLSREFREIKSYQVEFLREMRDRIKEKFEICEVRE